MFENTFHFTRLDVYLLLIFSAYLTLSILKRLPSTESIRRLVSTLDDRGGNIALLTFFSGWFFATSISLFYHAINLISNNKIDAKDAILMMALTWVTGSAFGGMQGALLKTLNGSMTVAPPNAAGTGVPQPPHVPPAPTTPEKPGA